MHEESTGKLSCKIINRIVVGRRVFLSDKMGRNYFLIRQKTVIPQLSCAQVEHFIEPVQKEATLRKLLFMLFPASFIKQKSNSDAFN